MGEAGAYKAHEDVIPEVNGLVSWEGFPEESELFWLAWRMVSIIVRVGSMQLFPSVKPYCSGSWVIFRILAIRLAISVEYILKMFSSMLRPL